MIFHNGQLSDPLCEWTKAIKKVSGKRNKTEADFEEMARLEFLGGLYTKDKQLVIPSQNLKASLAGKGGAARNEKRGKGAGVGIIVNGPFVLDYEGRPDDANDLWDNPDFRHRVGVRVSTSTVMRTRCVIPEGWTTTVSLTINEDFCDVDEVIRWMEYSGYAVGLGDWRPAKGGQYGRFEVLGHKIQ